MPLATHCLYVWQECGPGKLMLYGGVGSDSKPMNDAWVLNLEKPSWSLIYSGHSDLVPPQVGLLQCCTAQLQYS